MEAGLQRNYLATHLRSGEDAILVATRIASDAIHLGQVRFEIAYSRPLMRSLPPPISTPSQQSQWKSLNWEMELTNKPGNKLPCWPSGRRRIG
jgi:hypothetical protein